MGSKVLLNKTEHVGWLKLVLNRNPTQPPSPYPSVCVCVCVLVCVCWCEPAHICPLECRSQFQSHCSAPQREGGNSFTKAAADGCMADREQHEVGPPAVSNHTGSIQSQLHFYCSFQSPHIPDRAA